MSTKQKSITEYANDLATKLDSFFVGSLPALPDNAKEFIVKFSPYLTLILAVMFLPILLAALGIGAFFLPFSFLGGVGTGVGYMIGMVFAFGAMTLQFMALPGLFKRERKAWNLIYYASLLSILNNLFSAGIGSSALSAFISFYFLFQVKSKYTK